MSSSLAQYQLIFKNHGGEVFASEFFKAHDDRAAIEKANTEYRSGIGAGYEIWQGDRLVHSARSTF